MAILLDDGLNTPIGVGWPDWPVEMPPWATRLPSRNTVTFWVPIETTICSGPLGISPKPGSTFGAACRTLAVVAAEDRARRTV